jgi:hypothetical protein
LVISENDKTSLLSLDNNEPSELRKSLVGDAELEGIQALMKPQVDETKEKVKNEWSDEDIVISEGDEINGNESLDHKNEVSNSTD